MWALRFYRMAGTQPPSPLNSCPESRARCPLALRATDTGFVLEVEERWNQDGEEWRCQEFMRADVPRGAVSALSVNCTGGWEAEQRGKHAARVTLIRP